MGSIDKAIIRTSDRGTFRRCRQLWDFTSKIRMNYEWVPGIEPLDFGIAIHAGLDVYYDPARWEQPRHVVHIESIQAFLAHMKDWKERLNRSGQWNTRADMWQDHHDKGIGMLEHYFQYAPDTIDRHIVPVRSEIEFEVPIPIPGDMRELVLSRPRFARNREGNLMYLTDDGIWVPVVYQGRVDLLLLNKLTGKYRIRDHKTAAQFGQTEHLELDQQTGSYLWALWKLLGLDIETVEYSELKKEVPHAPRILKSGALSVAKNQLTTKAMYRDTIRCLGLNPTDYDTFLNNFEESEYFRLIEVNRNHAELADLERNIVMEAIDMLDDPLIYPNPDRWNCNGCAMRTPCLMRRDGSDWQWHLDESGLYERRGEREKAKEAVTTTAVDLGPSPELGSL